MLIDSLAVDAYGPSRGCIVDDEPPIIAPITTDYCSLTKLIQPLGSDSDGFTSVRFRIQTDKLLRIKIHYSWILPTKLATSV